MICIICESRFYPQTRMEPAETCECGMEFTREDARMDPDRAKALMVWWKESAGKSQAEALDAWRNSGL
jgi:hypothetical protein